MRAGLAARPAARGLAGDSLGVVGQQAREAGDDDRDEDGGQHDERSPFAKLYSYYIPNGEICQGQEKR